MDAACSTLVSRILDAEGRAEVAEETLESAERIMRRLAEAPSASGVAAEDLRDDRLLGHDEAAALILGLQDRTTRDRAAAWMEGDEAGPAMRLWRALARRCVGPYAEHAAAPLTLAGWVAWSTGDELEAREALAMALGADPDYLFARLLHQACNEGLDPESIRRCLREGGKGGQGAGETTADEDAPGAPSAKPEPARPVAATPSGGRRRTRSPAPPRAVRGRARTRGGESGTEAGRPRTSSGAGRPGTARTDRARPHASGTPVTGGRGACPEGAGTAERGSRGGSERP
ncbi:hypothetical protein SUDANB9_05477 [Streptomyces sp. enrichment culture]